MTLLLRVRLPEHAENRGALQIFARGGVAGINCGAPGFGIFFIGELRDGQLREIGVAEKFSAVEKSAAEGFGGQVDGFRGAAAGFRQIVTFQNVQRFDEHDSAGGRRRRADDFVAAVCAAQRLAFFYLVMREVFDGEQSPALLYRRGEFTGHGAVIKIVGIFGDAFKSVRQIRLAEDFVLFVEISVALKDFARFGIIGEVRIFAQILRLLPGQYEPAARQANRWSHHLRQRQLAVFFFSVDQSRHRARDADRFVAVFAGAGNHVAVGVEIHVGGGGGRSLLAKIDEMIFAVRGAQQHESSAAEISRLRIDHCEREAGGHRGVHRVAALAHNFHAGFGREFVNAGDDGVRRVHRPRISAQRGRRNEWQKLPVQRAASRLAA